MAKTKETTSDSRPNDTPYTYINTIHIYIDIYILYIYYCIKTYGAVRVRFPAQIVGILCTKEMTTK